MQDFFRDYLAQLRATLEEIDGARLEQLADRLHAARMAGQTVFLIGNGGSAATASHFACDLAKGAAVPGVPPLKALALTDNVALLTAVGNDFSYEDVFVEQLKVFLRPDDVVIAITASGNSPNILRAVEYARQGGAWIAGLLGFGGGALRARVDLDVTVSTRNYGCAEDMHLVVSHCVSQYLKCKSER